jgi:hypothetical protein
MPVFQLIYRSRAAQVFTEPDLVELLRQCREFNSSKDISGLLLHGYGHFLQVLEGESDEVLDLYYSKIAKDTRHQEVTVLHQDLVPKRLFRDWSMAFRSLSPKDMREVSGYRFPNEAPGAKGNLLAPLQLFELVQGFSLELNQRSK